MLTQTTYQAIFPWKQTKCSLKWKTGTNCSYVLQWKSISEGWVKDWRKFVFYSIREMLKFRILTWRITLDVSTHCTGTFCHTLTRLMIVVKRNNISDCVRTDASPYVRLFGAASSKYTTASLNEYEAKPPAMLNQTPGGKKWINNKDQINKNISFVEHSHTIFSPSKYFIIFIQYYQNDETTKVGQFSPCISHCVVHIMS